MVVCGNGNVADFCAERDMLVCETWDGELEKYRGRCCVIVTDREMSESEYYFKKGVMLNRGVELISTRYKDDKRMMEYLSYVKERQKEKYGGRQPFGFRRVNGVVVEDDAMMYVARKIIELRDSGMTLREIRDFPEIRHPDGRKISISTIQQIVKKREKYE